MFKYHLLLLEFFFLLLGAFLNASAGQMDTVRLGTNSEAQFGSIPGRTGSDCVLDGTQYQVETSFGALFHLRSNKNVDLYVRIGQRVTIENGRIIADFVSTSPLGIEDIGLGQAGTYFAAVSNCAEGKADYAIGVRPVVDQPEVTQVAECRVSRDSSGDISLNILGGPFFPGSVVLLNSQAAKTIVLKKQRMFGGGFSKIVASGRVCPNLPGMITVATPYTSVSQPFLCVERCLN